MPQECHTFVTDSRNTHTTERESPSHTQQSRVLLSCWLPDRDLLLGPPHCNRQHENLFVNKLETGLGPHSEEVFPPNEL